MRNKISLLMALVLLMVLLPAVGAGAAPRAHDLSVGSWTLPLPVEHLRFSAKLAARDINWRVPTAATIQLGYVTCADDCQRVIEVTYEIDGTDRYPQHLHLAGEVQHPLYTGACESYQFINIRDREGTFMVGTVSPVSDTCIAP